MTKPHIVMLAGWGQTGEVFSELATLLNRDFTITFTSVCELADTWRATRGDLPGSGSQSAPSGYAQQFHDSYIRDGPAIILGWSMGGMVALEAAHWFPADVERLILAAPCASFCCREDYTAGIHVAKVEEMIAGLTTDRRQTMAWFLRQIYRKSISQLDFEQKLVDSLRLDHELLQNGLEYLRDTDLRGIVSKLRQQVLLLHGEQDRIIRPEAALYLQERLPQGTLHLLPQGTHGFCEQFPVEIANRIRGFTGE